VRFVGSQNLSVRIKCGSTWYGFKGGIQAPSETGQRLFKHGICPTCVREREVEFKEKSGEVGGERSSPDW